jgi:hypothetical protein
MDGVISSEQLDQTKDRPFLRAVPVFVQAFLNFVQGVGLEVIFKADRSLFRQNPSASRVLLIYVKAADETYRSKTVLSRG